MALLADASAEVNSNLVGGAPSQSKVFTMPGGVAIKVQTVVATVTNAAATAVTPEITIRDQSGVVIDSNKQGDSIPAGDSGTATFALRLSGGSSTPVNAIRFGVVNTGSWLEVHTTTNLAPGGGGIFFQADSGGMTIQSQGQPDSQFQVLADFVLFDLSNNNFRIINASLIDLNGASLSFTGTSDWVLSSANASVGIDSGDNVNITLANGKPLTVSDHLGNPIFRVDEDGDLHGLTGKALTFDL